MYKTMFCFMYRDYASHMNKIKKKTKMCQMVLRISSSKVVCLSNFALICLFHSYRLCNIGKVFSPDWTVLFNWQKQKKCLMNSKIPMHVLYINNIYLFAFVTGQQIFNYLVICSFFLSRSNFLLHSYKIKT